MPVQIEAVAQAHSLGPQALRSAKQLTPAEVAARPSSGLVREDPGAVARAVVEVARSLGGTQSRRVLREGDRKGGEKEQPGEEGRVATEAQADSRGVTGVAERQGRSGEGGVGGRSEAQVAAATAQRRVEARATEAALLVAVGVVSRLSEASLRRARMLAGLQSDPVGVPLRNAGEAVAVAGVAGARIVGNRRGTVTGQAQGLSTIARLLLGA